MLFFEATVQRLFLIALVAMLFVHSVQAEENIRAAEVSHGVCRDEAKLASHIMAKRQKNIPLIELMGIAAGIEADAERGLLETYIEQAFDTPLYSSEEKVKAVVEGFGREIYLECRSALNKRFSRQQVQPSLSK